MSEGAPAEEGRNRRPGNLTLRVASALVLAALALGLTYAGGMAFRLFAAVLAALVFHEWTAMRPSESRSHKVVAWAVMAMALLAVLGGLSAPLEAAILAACFLVAFIYGVFTGSSGWSAYGIVYAGLPAIALSHLRGSDAAGLTAILFLYAVVWGTDILAYFVGRAAGGPKLAPAISPGKTWSGAAGGAAGGVLAGVAVAYFSHSALSAGLAVALALLLSAASQAGDLFESMVKRRRGVKDSGTLIPGHGGVMDRVDGLVAAAVLLYLLGVVFSGLAMPAGLFFR
ncbi:phosphatidate cytidylyltransferase [Chelativorans sp. AA-79]|uniref:phosphatidate cytidylyltransferase n=1 Tax=Chelativorans sp. AA-79 TaxID=3028735 RepID=UPI0023F6A66E|nr:phosphatidate cytidylyltransferase [Chelativorans sp. AA-79]WEX07043.1 phosphatidate cytidylyltransferase [Chelativorans sp. AA-79]